MESKKPTTSYDDSLDTFLHSMDFETVKESEGLVPEGVDRQLHNHYLAITGLVSSQVLHARDQINAISTFLERQHDPHLFKSRIPGASLLHRVVGRLTRRHFSELFGAIEQTRIALNMTQDNIEGLFLSIERFQSTEGATNIDSYIALTHRLELEIDVLKKQLGAIDG